MIINGNGFSDHKETDELLELKEKQEKEVIEARNKKDKIDNESLYYKIVSSAEVKNRPIKPGERPIKPGEFVEINKVIVPGDDER